MNIFVGRLSYETQEKDLRALFEQYGVVKSLKIITDRETGKSKGFAFVTMLNNDEGQNAIDQLNGAALNGRSIAVSQAEDRRAGPGGERKPSTPPASPGFRPNREESRPKPIEKDDDDKPDFSSGGWSDNAEKGGGKRNKSKKKKEAPRSKGDDDAFRKKKLGPKPKKNRGWQDYDDDLDDYSF